MQIDTLRDLRKAFVVIAENSNHNFMNDLASYLLSLGESELEEFMSSPGSIQLRLLDQNSG